MAVEGHTDDRGDPELNVDLSVRRARRVVEFLVADGVAPHRLDPQGFGSTRPVADNRTEEGRADNRRVSFVLADEVLPEGRP